MKIFVIGSGGREHAIAWAMQREGQQHSTPQLFCAPGSAGIAHYAQCVPINITNIPALAQFAEKEKVDLTVVGSEAPLAAGIADEFERRGLPLVGPHQQAARLESSKAFAKAFMVRHHIPTARFRIAESISEAQKILQSGEFGGQDAPVVIKADGLAAGKGVTVAGSRAEAQQAVQDLMEGGREAAAQRVVIEEQLTGLEASLLLWTDGQDYKLMPPARDHKRVGENDSGPNTGGMGAVTAPDVLSDDMIKHVVSKVVEPTLQGALDEGLKFCGVLYIGLMLTAAGPRVLEYNVRFGDPEAQALLVRLRSDLVEVCEAVAHKQLGRLSVKWSGDASACVVLAARGYPEHPETGARIEGLEQAAQMPDVRIFHAGTERTEEGTWITKGGRVLNVAATGPTLDQALSRCYSAINGIHWNGMHYRRDIGKFRSIVEHT